MSVEYVVKLTMDDCKKLGIVVCANCGYPPNNHWDETNEETVIGSACAHAPCKGYEPRFRYGKAM